MPACERNSDGVNWLPAFRSLSFELQGPCSAFTSWRARIRYTQALALPAHNQKLVLRHVAFVLQQLFQISLERGLGFNHRIEGFLHLGRKIICIDVLPLQFFPCHALLQLGGTKRHPLIRDHPKSSRMVCTGLAFGSTAQRIPGQVSGTVRPAPTDANSSRWHLSPVL